VIAIFALGAVFGWPAMLAAVAALVGFCVWREHQLPKRPPEPIDWRHDIAHTVAFTMVVIVVLPVTFGLVWVFYNLGHVALWVCVGAICWLCAWLEGRAPMGGGDWLSDSLLGHSTGALPPSGTPQIGRASTAVARRSSNSSPTVSGRQDNNPHPGHVARR
jgi:hypothetical protein